MPTSWEIKESNKVAVCILHTETSSIAWSRGYRDLKLPGREDLRTFDPFFFQTGTPYDHGRNLSVSYMLQNGADWWFGLDSDLVWPRDIVPRLIQQSETHRIPVISGMYFRRSPPHSLPVAIRGGTWLQDYKPGSLVPVDLVGAGGLLIHRSVFERLKYSRPEAGKTYFDWRVDARGCSPFPDNECMSEDFTLMLNIRKQLGIMPVLDTSIIGRHIGFCEFGPNGPQPCQVLPVA